MKTDESPLRSFQPHLWRRKLGSSSWGEGILQVILGLLACIPVVMVLAMISVLIYETLLFFQDVPPWRLLSDLQWTPLFPKQRFGIFVLASGTLMVTGIAMLVAMPMGLLAAIYLSEYASPSLHRWLKPILETLAGVPTVVYGYFALLFVTPLLKQWIPDVSGFNALSAGLVTGILIVPMVSSLSEDAIRNVPSHLHQGGYALGFTQQEVIVKILLPVAFPGIVASFTLAASRALGETMIAAIAAGLYPRLTLNPLEPVETMTAFILQISLGDIPFNSLGFRTIFTVGAVLFSITLALNTFGHWLVRRHQLAISDVVVPHAWVLQQQSHTSRTRDLPFASGTAEAPPPRSPQFNLAFTVRSWRDRLFQGLTLTAVLLGLIVLGTLLFNAAQDGLPRLNWQFLTSFASGNPQQAGIYPALAGTFWLLFLTALIAFPICMGASIFLEEYLPETLLSRALEINLANLTAVPSIIYGLLGLELFVRLLGGITGGQSILSAALTLTAIVLPLLIIATRLALRTVPESLRQGGYAVGMTRWQVVRHIVLPSAMPGIVTGMLLSLARAIGETAPLIAVGASAFVSFAPSFSLRELRSAFTVLPVQIFNWVSRPQEAFHANASAAILVLIGTIFVMNIVGILVRERYLQRPE
jgi:phosphate transport system permease protein